MKNFFVLSTFFVVILFLVATVGAETVFDGMDTDGDGSVSLQELRTVHPDVSDTVFGEADADANGLLSHDEWRMNNTAFGYGQGMGQGQRMGQGKGQGKGQGQGKGNGTGPRSGTGNCINQ